jgi:serine/threonine protein phosphatase PrpC
MNYKKQFSSDDNEKYNKNILTKYIWRSLDYKSFEEISLQKDEIWKWNILICSDGFYNILEKNKLLFHEILHYKRLWNIRNRLNKELYKKNIDDASYIYILTNTDV